jgi:DNA helicase-2/ATP-dependent DNA helicase PcrA
VYDWNDDALLLRIYQLRKGGVLNERNQIGTYGHILVDEVQDLSPIELATIIASVKAHKDLTLVGDASQNLDHTQAFPGWEVLRKHWNFNEEMSKYVSLEVSHRSTLPIMRLADHIQRRDIVRSGRPGRTPIWFKCRDESQGIEHILKWLSKASELYPTKIAAVICADPQDASFAYKMLQPTFGPRVRRGDAYSFSFEEGILVTDVRQVKGLEFYSVLLWNPSAATYGSSELANNLLYVAVTRAEENLCIVTWDRPARALPTFGASRLIRSNDMTIRDDEEESSVSNDD